MIDWLKEYSSREEGALTYSLSKVKDRFDVREILPDRGWLVLDFDPDELHLRFAVFEHYCELGDKVQATAVFHGRGPMGALRECRHTYWGEDGYLFYPNGPVIAAAFTVLAEFFDDMVGKNG